jgi:hypothetical protein
MSIFATQQRFWIETRFLTQGAIAQINSSTRNRVSMIIFSTQRRFWIETRFIIPQEKCGKLRYAALAYRYPKYLETKNRVKDVFSTNFWQIPRRNPVSHTRSAVSFAMPLG